MCGVNYRFMENAGYEQSTARALPSSEDVVRVRYDRPLFATMRRVRAFLSVVDDASFGRACLAAPPKAGRREEYVRLCAAALAGLVGRNAPSGIMVSAAFHDEETETVLSSKLLSETPRERSRERSGDMKNELLVAKNIRRSFIEYIEKTCGPEEISPERAVHAAMKLLLDDGRFSNNDFFFLWTDGDGKLWESVVNHPPLSRK